MFSHILRKTYIITFQQTQASVALMPLSANKLKYMFHGSDKSVWKTDVLIYCYFLGNRFFPIGKGKILIILSEWDMSLFSNNGKIWTGLKPRGFH